MIVEVSGMRFLKLNDISTPELAIIQLVHSGDSDVVMSGIEHFNKNNEGSSEYSGKLTMCTVALSIKNGRHYITDDTIQKLSEFIKSLSGDTWLIIQSEDSESAMAVAAVAFKYHSLGDNPVWSCPHESVNASIYRSLLGAVLDLTTDEQLAQLDEDIQQLQERKQMLMEQYRRKYFD